MRPLAIYLVTCIILATTGALSAQPAQEKSVAERVTALVDRLGNPKFVERERAQKELEALGPAALTALLPALESPNAEVRLRTQVVFRKLAELESATIPLAGRRVRLNLKDTTLQDAVRELARQSGYPVSFQDKALTGRKLTLDTGHTTFWEALHRLSLNADLVERVSGELQGPEIVGDPNVRWVSSYFNPQANRIMHLGAGKQSHRPVCFAGSVRIWLLKAERGKDDDIDVLLEVANEWRLSDFTVIGGAWVDKAIDEHGQSLAGSFVAHQPLPAPMRAGGGGTFSIQKIGGAGIGGGVGGAMGGGIGGGMGAGMGAGGPWDKTPEKSSGLITPEDLRNLQAVAELFAPSWGLLRGKEVMRNADSECTGPIIRLGAPLTGFRFQHVELRLKSAEKLARILPELSGQIPVQTAVDEGPLLVVENILQASGRTFRGKGEVRLRVLDVKKLSNNLLEIKVSIDNLPNENAASLAPGARLDLEVNQWKIRSNGPSRSIQPFRLLDGSDVQYEPIEANFDNFVYRSGPQTKTLVFRPSPGQGPPVRLMMMGYRVHNFCVPFTLRNVAIDK